ncbi:hypothetical protein ACJX0J_029460, partial [Zea mays]
TENRYVQIYAWFDNPLLSVAVGRRDGENTEICDRDKGMHREIWDGTGIMLYLLRQSERQTLHKRVRAGVVCEGWQESFSFSNFLSSITNGRRRQC